jgi:hypothetical protein
LRPASCSLFRCSKIGFGLCQISCGLFRCSEIGLGLGQISCGPFRLRRERPPPGPDVQTACSQFREALVEPSFEIDFLG